MRKIQKIVLSDTYQKISSDTILPGVLITFDCYIQRFNSYVIIIKAGTIISETLHEKLQRKELYISNADRKNYDHYKETRKRSDKFTSELLEIVNSEESVKTKISHSYKLMNAYMSTYFQEENTRLDLATVNQYVETLLGILYNQHYVLEDFSVTLDSVYSEANHCVNVSIFSALFAQVNGFEYEEARKVTLAGLLHDLGKRAIDKSVLEKRTTLDEKEFELMQTHSGLSVEEAKKMGVVDETILNAIKGHHEKLDGTGYPNGLILPQISKSAQIVAICDTFDALTTKRTFRDEYSSYNALLMMKQEMSTQLNRIFITKFIKMFKRE